MVRMQPIKSIACLVAVLLLASIVGAQQVEYYHLDALGSVRAITDENGAVITRHDYLPYGEEWNAPPSNDTRMFSGKAQDQETQLHYFGARYYGAGIAIFTAVDPAMTADANLVDPQRWNRYTYARGNPILYVDPDGREPNKSQATNPAQLVRFVQNTPGATAKDQLAILGQYSTLGGSNPARKRYIYTTKAGWIDLVHFFNVAMEVDKRAAAERGAAWTVGGFPLWQETKRIENDQEANGNVGTAWSYEDAPSNYYGWLFWRNYYDPEGDLHEQVQRFLDDQGGAAPQSAPNWKQMWKSEQPYQRQFPQNKSFSPKYTR